MSHPPGPQDWVVAGNTAQLLRDSSSGLVEHYEARRAGIEVSWVLPRRPDADRLVVEAEIRGAEFRGSSVAGLEFAASDNTTRIIVGRVQAVDRGGRMWDIPIDQSGSLLRISVPRTVLADASYPLAIDPLISPEFGFGEPVDGPTPGTRAAPAVAANESGYLVTWTHGAGGTTPAGVYAARLDAAGRLLDPYGISVGSAGEQTTCAVAANPGSFLIAWSGPRGTTTDWDIFGARLQSDGTVLDKIPLTICGVASTPQCTPAAAANGTNYLVVWRDGRSTGIYGNVIGPDGRVALTNGFVICSAANDQFTPAVASLAGNYLVAWQDYRSATFARFHSDIYGARVTSSGQLMDTNGIAICTLTNSQWHPAVAADGTNYLVVWEDYDVEGNDIRGVRVSLDGLVLDAAPVSVSHGRNAQCFPAVTETSNGWMVAWQDYSPSLTNGFIAQVRGTSVGTDGSVATPGGFAISRGTGRQSSPSLAAHQGEPIVVWQDDRNNPATTLADIFGAQIGSGQEPVPQPDFRVSGAANAQLAPAVTANCTNYLVAWTDNRNAATNGLDILALRLNQDGGLLDLAPIPVCTLTNNQSDPAVAANGESYLVAWSDYRNTPASAMHGDIYASLISLSGQPATMNGFVICAATNDQAMPALTALGTNFLAVWQDARGSAGTVTRLDIYGARVSGAGEVLDPDGFPISTNQGNQTLPAVAANNTQALVAWTDFRSSTVSSDIYAARVTRQAEVLDLSGLPLCTALAAQHSPTVASDGTGFLVAWSDARNGSANGTDIYGVNVSADGVTTPTNGFPIRVGVGFQTAPVAAFNGLDYLVAWQESAGSVSNSFDILATGVNADGTLWSGPPLVINNSSENQTAPSAAAGLDRRFLVVDQGFIYATPRLVANVADISAFPRLSAPRLIGGQAELELRGAPGRRYSIETSSDLTTWIPLESFTLTNSPTRSFDPAAASNHIRFYRALLLP